MPNDQITQTTWQNEADAWTNQGAAPSSELLTDGFTAGYKPPAAVFNRLFYKFRVIIAEIHSVITTLQQETAGYFSSIQTALSNKANASHSHDDRYYTESEIDTKLSGKAATSHDHDSRYYTESEVDSKLGEKAAALHTHDDRYYTESEVDTLLSAKQDSLTIDPAMDANSSNPVRNSAITDALGNKANASHTHDDRYYTESEIDTMLSQLSQSSAAHVHSAADITSGILPVARGGTGVSELSTSPSSSSVAPITSKAVYFALLPKIDYTVFSPHYVTTTLRPDDIKNTGVYIYKASANSLTGSLLFVLSDSANLNGIQIEIGLGGIFANEARMRSFSSTQDATDATETTFSNWRSFAFT